MRGFPEQANGYGKPSIIMSLTAGPPFRHTAISCACRMIRSRHRDDPLCVAVPLTRPSPSARRFSGQGRPHCGASFAEGLQGEDRRSLPSAETLAHRARSAAIVTRVPLAKTSVVRREPQTFSPALPSSAPLLVRFLLSLAIRPHYIGLRSRAEAQQISVCVIPGFCISYGPISEEQGPASEKAACGCFMAQRPTLCVASRAQAAPR